MIKNVFLILSIALQSNIAIIIKVKNYAQYQNVIIETKL